MDMAINSPIQRDVGIYIHVPYCRTLCPYCDFVKQRSRGQAPEVFTDALIREIGAYDGPALAQSVFFGGGTPSLLAPRALECIFATLHRRFTFAGKPEVTLEANPDDVSRDLAKTWLDLGINRISLGVQSFHEATLRHLGRRHDAASALRACETIASLFDNWNLDLIFGAPPIEHWPDTLARTVALRPPHVATYGLTYEPGTPFERRRDQAVDDETWLRLYRQAEEVLGDYEHYEISNLARPGFQSRHNLMRIIPVSARGPTHSSAACARGTTPRTTPTSPILGGRKSVSH
ncbi:MAG: coproporphyrinogen III oxidase family protein [Candidatus Hydrogenedentes bacterium]|nr:coproporphyrinogen III oxidase family protein [Candidatus Hydrogenedentota bacterium]